MKADCPQRELSDALTLTGNAARSNTPRPILQTYKVEAKDGGLRVLGLRWRNVGRKGPRLYGA
jgi:hypothetical protein